MSAFPVFPCVPRLVGYAFPRPIGGTHHTYTSGPVPQGTQKRGTDQSCLHCGSRVIERGICLDCGRPAR